MKINVPIWKTVDCLILGGTIAAVKAALDLHKAGASVFIATPYSYFGEDLCATLDMQSEKSDDFKAIFGDYTKTEYFHTVCGEEVTAPTPMFVKSTLDKVLMSVGVEWIFTATPVALAEDADGKLAGCVIADRSGFQLIAAKCILDATKYGIAAKLAGAKTAPMQPGEYNVSLIQIGAYNVHEGVHAALLPEPVVDNVSTLCGGEFYRENAPFYKYPVYKLTKKFYFSEFSAAEMNLVTMEMRHLCWHPDVILTADECIFEFNGANTVLPPKNEPAVLLPGKFSTAKDFISNPVAIPVKIRLCKTPVTNFDVSCKNDACAFRSDGCKTVPLELNGLPAFCESADVLVVGGGTGGAPAAIGAGRAGAKVIVTEAQSQPGGVCTCGRIGNYYFGNRVGFTAELDRACAELHPKYAADIKRGAMNTSSKQEWLAHEAMKVNAEYRYQTLCIAAITDGKRVAGAVCAGPFGTEVICAKSCVDATGNADLVADAGGDCMPIVEEEPAIQGAGLAPVRLNSSYENTDYAFVCDCDVCDATGLFVMAHDKFKNWFDCTQILDTRERRRIVGDLTLQPCDFYGHRMYSDTLNIAYSNFDTHGFIIHPMFMLKPTAHDPYYAKVPLRAMMPHNLTGVIVTGLALSAHRDCLPLIRMQPDVQNHGYAAGMLAARAAAANCDYRDLEVRDWQRQLVAEGHFPEAILSEADALGGIEKDDSHFELASIFLSPEKSKQELLAKFAADSDDAYTAHILAFLGVDAGKSLLVSELNKSAWDTGWNYRGMGQYGMSVSPVDSLIFAITKIGGDKDAVLTKLNALQENSEFSHFRSVCFALMKHPDARAIPDLERLLAAPSIANSALSDFAAICRANQPMTSSYSFDNEPRNDTQKRNSQLKELYLAKALSACNPKSEKAQGVLKSYANSSQTYYAKFAEMNGGQK